MRRIRYASFKGSKREAKIELARLIAENAAGTGIDPTKTTVAEFFERWDRDWASINYDGKTLERYRELIALYIKPHIGGARIQRLQPVNLNESGTKLLREGGKDGTVFGAAHRRACPPTVASRAQPCGHLGHRVSKCCFGRGPAQGARSRNHRPD